MIPPPLPLPQVRSHYPSPTGGTQIISDKVGDLGDTADAPDPARVEIVKKLWLADDVTGSKDLLLTLHAPDLKDPLALSPPDPCFPAEVGTTPQSAAIQL
jgi:hypothetical protein